jgi:hypothetical protein
VKKATTAALLSGLVFPGVGQLYLKRIARGSMLALCAAIAMYIVVDAAVAMALQVAQSIEAGDVALDAGAIEALVARRSAGAGSLASLAQYLFLALWVVGIVDAYRLGRALDDPATNVARPEG